MHRFFTRLFTQTNLMRSVAWGSFMESFFLPIIIDPILIGAVILDRKRWMQYSAIATLTSVLGALCAYIVGAFFFNLIGQQVIDFFGFEAAFQSIETYLSRGVVIFTLIGAITPIPYKLVALVAGLFHLNIVLFLLASIIGRSVRFFIIGYMAYLSRTHAHRLVPYLTWRYALLGGFILGVVTIYWYM